MTHHITITDDGPVRLVTMNRPEKKNALTGAMYDALTDAMTSADASDDIGVVVFAGHDSIFSAGNDIKDFMQNPPRADNPDAPVWRFLTTISTVNVPLMACVRGPAVGVGLTMLLHCDLVYAGEGASFSTPFTKLGLAPEAASSLLLPQAIGRAKANALLLLSETFTAAQAERAGLVTELFPDDRALDETLARARALCALPTSGVTQAKRLIKMCDASAVATQMATEGEVFTALLQSPQFRQIAAAFLGHSPADT